MLSPVLDLTSDPPLWLKTTVVAVWVSFILFLAWVVYRFAKGEPEIVRKIVHIGTGNVIMLAWWLNVPASLGITASIVASGITLLSYRFPIFPGINSVGRRSFGTFFYAVSIGILVAWFWHIQQPQYAAIGIMVMAWGDGLAALIGQRFGKHKYKVLGAQKSWEGSLTMTLASYTITSLILLSVEGNIWPIWVVSLAIALTATCLEAISFLGIDNLTVPLGSAALAFFLIDTFLVHSR
ncbi:SEC59/DGK1/VTE5 family protein [Chrysosporum ovalisporum Ak1311]|uniref:SEC59/DGK1/VTE5 family protein n=2 Tax=Umezakia ovalisporum TaxID=75695 RepID=A0AA43H0N1_9CYAN|nr:diacylglycerol/polyprenol kinase family protein [Umezakia ovalisporum]MBI1241432.1 phosphatidate cytidylyltransferase [Nostoc sp. RI_552]MDH6058159.1 SEC59/DGK1/VTE5 family protein [Umezakia ovalisporum FSS-43]MDH6064548.1 SEC59/DGK1/VTE5 family protein [Umezakia ovalisporum FSS-62]MDH6073605.1 SEC59/DGK1/VTE5 family protein [Umezakia ovalisporum CS-1034]MDH6079250.1 SEC59/DGK1/VTE5 family protein [Umezakia ovalisporum FSS-45]